MYLFFALVCNNLFAEAVNEEQHTNQSWYQVEVLIFRYNTNFEASQEQWPKKIDRSFPPNLSILNHNKTPTPRDTFTALLPEDFTFSSYLTELERKNNIKPLYHTAWRQPRIDKLKSQPLLIQAGSITEDGQFELEGTIKISIKRYIHIDTDLWLSKYEKTEVVPESDWWAFPADEKPFVLQDNLIRTEINKTLDAPITGRALAPIGSVSPSYHTKYIARMQQTRRMNRDELHYLDHPLFGLLVKTVRYEMPEEQLPISETGL